MTIVINYLQYTHKNGRNVKNIVINLTFLFNLLDKG